MSSVRLFVVSCVACLCGCLNVCRPFCRSAAAERAADDPEAAAAAERRLMTSPTDDIVKDGLTDGVSGRYYSDALVALGV